MFKSIYKNRILWVMALIAILLGGTNVGRSQNKKINKPAPATTKKPYNPALQKPVATPAKGQTLSPSMSQEGKKIYVFLKAHCPWANPYFQLANTEFGPGKPGILASCSSSQTSGASYLLETPSGVVRSLLQLNGSDQSRIGFRTSTVIKGYYDVMTTDGYRSYFYRWNGHRYIPHNF